MISARSTAKSSSAASRETSPSPKTSAQPGDVEPAHLPPVNERGDDRPALIDREGHWFGHIPPPPDSPV